MKKLLGPYSDLLFAVLRIVAALMFLAHGLQKFNVAMLGGFQPAVFRAHGCRVDRNDRRDS